MFFVHQTLHPTPEDLSHSTGGGVQAQKVFVTSPGGPKAQPCGDLRAHSSPLTRTHLSHLGPVESEPQATPELLVQEVGVRPRTYTSPGLRETGLWEPLARGTGPGFWCCPTTDELY